MQLKKLFVPLLAGMLFLGGTSGAIAKNYCARSLSRGAAKKPLPRVFLKYALGRGAGATATQVQADIAKRSNQVVDFLKSKNVAKLTTTGINLQPEYDYNNGDRRLIGYLATNTVSFEVPTAQAGSLMDEAVKVGATRIDGISFRATEAALAEAEKTALAEAAQDARTQAQNCPRCLGFESPGNCPNPGQWGDAANPHF